MASLTKTEGQNNTTREKVSENNYKACQMINSTLLEVRGDNKRRPRPDFELEEIKIYEDDERVIRIVTDLPSNDKDNLISLIKQFKEVFAWSPADMPGIDAKVACHKLSINPNIKLVQ